MARVQNNPFAVDDARCLDDVSDADIEAWADEHTRLGMAHHDQAETLRLTVRARQRARAGVQCDDSDRCPYGCTVSGFRSGGFSHYKAHFDLDGGIDLYALCKVHRLCWWRGWYRDLTRLDGTFYQPQPWLPGEDQEYRHIRHPESVGPFSDGRLLDEATFSDAAPDPRRVH